MKTLMGRIDVIPRLQESLLWFAMTWTCITTLTFPSLHAEEIPDLYLHEGTSLNGEWKSIINPDESGSYDYHLEPRDLRNSPSLSESFFLDVKSTHPGDRIAYNFDTSPSLQVPGDWNTQSHELYYYEGSVWYRRTVDPVQLTDGKRVFIRFGAVNYSADLYLNGKKLGAHVGCFTPFTFEIGNHHKAGSNPLVLRVDNKRSMEGVPTQGTGLFPHPPRSCMNTTPGMVGLSFLAAYSRNSRHAKPGPVVSFKESKHQSRHQSYNAQKTIILTLHPLSNK